MVKKKVCQKCRSFVEGNECPVCKGNKFSGSWQGRIAVIEPEKSKVAKETGIEKKGEYAIKVR